MIEDFHFERPEPSAEAASPLRLRNSLQVELAKRHCAECDNAALVEWIFAELSPKVAELLTRRPELLGEYAKDPRATLDRIDAELHLEHHMAQE